MFRPLTNVDTQQALDIHHPHAQGLVGFWKTLPNLRGSKWYDLSPYGNHGTLTNGPTWSNGREGLGALSFDGVDDYVDYGTTIDEMLSNGTTFSAWLYTNDASLTQGILNTYKGDGNSDGWQFRVNGNDITIGLFDSSGGDKIGRQTTGDEISDNTWHQVSATWNGGFSSDSFGIYIDGIKTDDADFSDGTVDSYNESDLSFASGILYFSAGATGFFNGLIDDVRIYNRALSASEVGDIYEDSLGCYDILRRVNRNAFWYTGSTVNLSWLYGLQQNQIIGGGVL